MSVSASLKWTFVVICSHVGSLTCASAFDNAIYRTLLINYYAEYTRFSMGLALNRYYIRETDCPWISRQDTQHTWWSVIVTDEDLSNSSQFTSPPLPPNIEDFTLSWNNNQTDITNDGPPPTPSRVSMNPSNLDNFTWHWNVNQTIINNNQQHFAIPMSKGDEASEYWINTLNFTADATTPMLNMLTKICPTTKSCLELGNDTRAGDVTDGCCVRCDCTNDCLAIGNCCHNYDAMPQLFIKGLPATTMFETCLYPELKSKRACNMKKNVGAQLMVSTCQSVYVDLNIYMKCSEPSVDILDEVQPVYSTKTNLSYINKYCAKCNYVDEETLVNWQSKLVYLSFAIMKFVPMRSVSSNIIISNLHDYSDCSLVWFLPPGAIPRPCYPKEDLIAGCSDRQLTPHIIDLCVSGIQQPYGSPNGAVYRNPFCFICSLSRPVKEIHPDSCHEELVFKEFSERVEALFHPAAYDTWIPSYRMQSNTSGDIRCPHGLTFNNETDECLQMECASPMILYKGECVPILTEIRGVSLHYRIRVSVPIQRAAKLSMKALIADIRSFVLNSEVGDAYICRESITNKRVEDRLEFHFKFTKYVNSFVNIQRVYEELEVQVNAASTKEITIDIDKEFHRNVLDNPDYITYMPESPAYYGCPDGLAVSKLQFCKSVIFKLKDNQSASQSPASEFSSNDVPPINGFTPINDFQTSKVFQTTSSPSERSPTEHMFEGSPMVELPPSTEFSSNNPFFPNGMFPPNAAFTSTTETPPNNVLPQNVGSTKNNNYEGSPVLSPIDSSPETNETNELPSNQYFEHDYTLPQTVHRVTFDPSDYVMVFGGNSVYIKVCLDTYNTLRADALRTQIHSATICRSADPFLLLVYFLACILLKNNF